MPGYSMSADETLWWRDLAALLDPAAYEWIEGSNLTETVPSDETWYLVSAWYLVGPGTRGWFHRHGDIHEALPLSPDTALTTWTAGTSPGPSGATSFMYLCKPSLVVDGDSRYADDPRALYFDRIRAIGELEQFEVGVTDTGTSGAETAFPTDFDNGLVIHASTHDVAWTILSNVADDAGLILQDEISDSDRVRFASRVLLPFVRADFPSVRIRGANLSEGRSVVRYLKLPEGW